MLCFVPCLLIIISAFSVELTSSTPLDYSCLHSSSWRLNSNNDKSSNFNNVLTEITSSSLVNNKWQVVSNRIPKYDHVVTNDDVTALNSRPKKSTDFVSGQTTITAGTTLSFGTNVGYSTQRCSLGYWPPGPSCPTAVSGTSTFDVTPSPETKSSGCYASMVGSIGKFVNGISIYGWSDANSYNSKNTFYNLAPEFEVYDLDICNGHAANGDYHHHHYPKCLQELLGDDGTKGHSPIYGWAVDSYPLYGPYQAAGVLAQSCWKSRDYSSSSPTGCSSGTRCCVLKNQEDYTQGTTTLTGSNCGPSTTSTTTSLSGNTISTASGIYFQDYYYNSSCYTKDTSGTKLDSHNGHSHDNYGYHYHVTITSTGKAQFPYMIGPKYYGCRDSGSCCASPTSQSCGTGSVCGTTDGTSTFGCTTASVSGATFPTVTPTSPAGSRTPTRTPTPSPTTSSGSGGGGSPTDPDSNDDSPSSNSLTKGQVIIIAVVVPVGAVLFGIIAGLVFRFLTPGVAQPVVHAGVSSVPVPAHDIDEIAGQGDIPMVEAVVVRDDKCIEMAL